MCAVCFENWCIYVCSFSLRPLERRQCPSSCSPALTVFRSCPSSFCRTSTGHSFSHQSLLQEKTNFFETVSELFEERKTDTRLQLCAVTKNDTYCTLYTSRDAGFFLTNVELSVQSQRVLWSSGRSVRAAALRARRRPNRSTTVSSNWKKRVCSVPRRKVNKANCFFFF